MPILLKRLPFGRGHDRVQELRSRAGPSSAFGEPWDVVGGLVHRNFGGERHRVAATVHGTLGPQCGLNVTSARADVLLALHRDHPVANLDDIDELGCLKPPDQRREFATTRRAILVLSWLPWPSAP